MDDNSFAYSISKSTHRAGNAMYQGKNRDSFEVGATLGGLMETGSVVVAQIRNTIKRIACGPASETRGTRRVLPEIVSVVFSIMRNK